MRVRVILSKAYKGKVCGLCANADGKDNNDFRTREGMIVSGADQFANSWKTKDSCQVAQIPRDPCSLNPHRKAWAEKSCNIIHEPVFKKCHEAVSIQFRILRL